MEPHRTFLPAVARSCCACLLFASKALARGSELIHDNRVTNAKLQFLSERLKRRHPTLVYTVDELGYMHSFVVDPYKNWTLSNYGFVPDNSLTGPRSDAAWTAWNRVFHMVCRDDHCIDWTRVPRSALEGADIRQLRDAYPRYARNVTWFGDVSIGSKPQFAQNVKPAVKRNKKLPAGWRVIVGGAA